MAQSYAQVYLHAVFSTKKRIPCLTSAIREELFPYMATVVKNLGCHPVQVGGTEDHVHILSTLARTITIADFFEEVKKPTSKWLKTKGAALGKFYWQAGCGAFSVSASQTERVRRYILGQEEHHRTVTFKEEFLELLKKHEVSYKEEYLWD